MTCHACLEQKNNKYLTVSCTCSYEGIKPQNPPSPVIEPNTRVTGTNGDIYLVFNNVVCPECDITEAPVEYAFTRENEGGPPLCHTHFSKKYWRFSVYTKQ